MDERPAGAPLPDYPLPDPGFLAHAGIPPIDGIIACVGQRLVALGFLARPIPLAELHRHLPADAMDLDEHYTNAVGRAFYTPDAPMQDAYRRMIQFLARHLIPWDFLFQAHPIIRFHFPVPFPETMRTAAGRPRQIHSDILGGHPAQMVQGWAALTDCTDTAALQCSNREAGIALLSRYRNALGPDDPPFEDSLHHFYAAWDTDAGFGDAVEAACQPIPMRAGDLLLFDPHCLHGGAENREDATRVSLDFRLLPVAAEQAVAETAQTASARRFRRGEVFHASSGRELENTR